jgi:hypothetical protein
MMPIPEGRHDDWKWPLKLIPRRWTAVESNKPPIKLFGTAPADKHLDVPEPGTWVVAWPPHWAWTTKEIDINRVSLARYDYNGGYYQIFSLRLGSLTRRLKKLFNKS